MDRIFIDANVLFSAAYRPDAGVRRLWELKGVELITSAYAFEEARVNLPEGEPRSRLERLVRGMGVAAGHGERPLPEGIKLPRKDHPILLAAIHVRATHLLTGDFTHFGRYFGKALAGILILPPGDYLHFRSR